MTPRRYIRSSLYAFPDPSHSLLVRRLHSVSGSLSLDVLFKKPVYFQGVSPLCWERRPSYFHGSFPKVFLTSFPCCLAGTRSPPPTRWILVSFRSISFSFFPLGVVFPSHISPQLRGIAECHIFELLASQRTPFFDDSPTATFFWNSLPFLWWNPF